jgi:hypothetical protein
LLWSSFLSSSLRIPIKCLFFSRFIAHPQYMINPLPFAHSNCNIKGFCPVASQAWNYYLKLSYAHYSLQTSVNKCL